MQTRKRTRVFSFEPYLRNGEILSAQTDKPVNVAGLDQFITDPEECYEIVIEYVEEITVEARDHLYPGGTYVDIDPTDIHLMVGFHREEKRVELPKALQDAIFEAFTEQIYDAVAV